MKKQHIHKMWSLFSSLLEANIKKRLFAMIFLTWIIILLFIARLFYIQIIKGDYYYQLAQDQQYSKIIIPAKRWEILTENFKTWEINKLATNITLDLVYVDPKEIKDKQKVAKELAPILFNDDDFISCKEDIKLCPWVQFSDTEILLDNPNEEKKVLKDTRTKEQIILAYEQELYKKISKEEVDYSPLKYWATDEEMDAIDNLWVIWISVIRKSKLIYTDPTVVNQSRINEYSISLSEILDKDKTYFQRNLKRRDIRYIPLKRKLSLEDSDKIWKLKKESYSNYRKNPENNIHYFKGVVLVPEHWRYYPENELASTVIWYVDHEWSWNYWIEEKYDAKLRGKSWEILSKNDVQWWQVVFDDDMKEAEDWESVILTIDRVIQSKVNELLKWAVEKYRADSWQVIVADPFTGQIISMASYPNFNPNNFWDVYQMIKPSSEDWEWWELEKGEAEWERQEWIEDKSSIYPTQPIFIKGKKWGYQQVTYREIKDEFVEIQKAKDRIKDWEKWVEMPSESEKFVLKNRFWLSAYVNKAVMSLYEPWSVFKPIAMAIWLHTHSIDSPYETYEEYWPIQIDTGMVKRNWDKIYQYIRTALWKYRWIQTMTNAIEQSSNIGMAYVARKLWAELFYKYVMDFGFNELTYINLVWEQLWKIHFWKKWTEAKLITTSFGQGMSATPIQMIQAWSALINGWMLIQPQIVKAIIDTDWNREDIINDPIKRIISKSSAEQIKSMLVSSIDHWVAKPGWVEWYSVWWKTWTSQIACTDKTRCPTGRYERWEWTTITSFAWFAPADKPKFLVLVKFDRPRVWDNTWGSTTAAPVFHDVMEFLLKYYDVEKDRR